MEGKAPIVYAPHNDVRAVNAEDGNAQGVLQAEAAKIIGGAQRVGASEKPVPTLVKNRPLPDDTGGGPPFPPPRPLLHRLLDEPAQASAQMLLKPTPFLP